MKKIIASILFGSAVLGAHAANIKLEDTEANCKKVDGIGANDKMEIASKFGISVKTVDFLGAKWDVGPYGSKTCIFMFDTGVGPKKCRTLQLLSDDGGKTAFAIVSPNLCQ